MINSATTSPVSGTAAAAAAATSSGQTSTTPGGALGKDAFLKLLVAQMKNQDPMNPMQGDQMAAQLAQFSSLEQLQQINSTLSAQSSSSGSVLGAIQGTSAITTIGHTVVALGNQIKLGGDTGATSVNINLATAAASAKLHIYNSAGVEVGSRDLGAVDAGKQTINIGDAGSALPAGTYTYSVDGSDSAGKAVTVQTYMTGVVDGVSSGSNGLTLTSGGLSIPYANVIQILK